MTDGNNDRAKEEFFSESQEIIEGLSRDLLALEATERKGDSDPDIINDIFRAVHTLKGLSGLFGASVMSTLSHDLEEVLDDLRLGKRSLSRQVLDLLFRAVDVYGQILALEKTEGKSPGAASTTAEVEAFVTELAQLVRQPGQQASIAPELYELDPGLLAVLTEYEEHRLRSNLQNGLTLFRIRARFQLSTIDEELETLKGKAKPLGEIITYLPTGEGGDAESIDLEILIASRNPLDRLDTAIKGPNLRVEEVSRRGAHAAQLPLNPAQETETVMRARPKNFTALSAPPSHHSEPSAASASKSNREGPHGLSLRSVSQTVRVDIRKLDHLMNIIGELAIVRSSIGRITERVRLNPALRDLALELHRLHRGFERHLGDMQDGILQVRMVPIGQIFDKLGRVVRQASREAGKQINFVITGAETEVDKLIVEELSDPLMHMVRNSIDHGIEQQGARVAVGKPEAGTIAINAFQKGSHVLIEIEDDGRGLDEKQLINVGVQRGFLKPEEAAELTRREILGLIFLPGFTTKASADMLAGRGVGMDIVKTNIGRLGGVIDVQSELGIGTKMTVTLPITLAILSVLMVHVDTHAFAVPLSNVQEALVLDNTVVRTIEGREIIALRGATLPLVRLHRLFGLEPATLTLQKRGFIVVLSAGQRRLGIVVDHLEGQQDIVIKPLGPSLQQVRGFAGAAELGDQRIGLVLDIPALIEEVLASTELTKVSLSS